MFGSCKKIVSFRSCCTSRNFFLDCSPKCISGKIWKLRTKSRMIEIQQHSDHYFFYCFFFFSAFPPFFQFFFSVVYLSHRRSAWIQKVIKQNVIGEPKNLRSYPVLDPIGHFGVLHVVWTCRRWANVPGMARLYSIYCCVCFVSPQLTRIMYCRMFLQIIKKWDNQPTFMNLGWHALCLNMIWYSLFI